MLGIVWRDGNAKEMEVTLTQTEMAKVAVTTTGGEVEDDGEAEDLSLGFFGSRAMSEVGRHCEEVMDVGNQSNSREYRLHFLNVAARKKHKHRSFTAPKQLALFTGFFS